MITDADLELPDLPDELIVALLAAAARDINLDHREHPCGLPLHVSKEFTRAILALEDLTHAQFELILMRDGGGKNAQRYKNGKTALKFADAYGILSTLDSLYHPLTLDELANSASQRSALEAKAAEIHKSIDYWHSRFVAIEAVREYLDLHRRNSGGFGEEDVLIEWRGLFKNLLRTKALVGRAKLKNAGWPEAA